MAKLTPTELKVLAQEAENRIHAILKQKKDDIISSKDYREFEDNWNKLDLGVQFNNLIKQVGVVQALMKDFNCLDEVNKYYHSKNLLDEVISTKNKCIEHMKNDKFPMPKLNINTVTPDRWGMIRESSTYEYFLHKLSLNQLTTENDLSKMLDDLVKELASKIS